MLETSASLPEPLVPAEVDLRGLEYMPLLGAKLFESDFNLNATDAEFRYGLKLWWKAWNQTPAASLPNSERAQAKLAGFEDERSATWRKVRAHALYGFALCSDGRLYHPVLAKQALIAWEKRLEDREERDNSTERKRRDRAERKQMFAALRIVGVVPAWDIPKGELRKLHAEHVTPPVTVTGPTPAARPVTVTDTAKTGRDGTGHEFNGDDPTRSSAASAAARVLDPPPPSVQPSPAGVICRAMRKVGIADANPGHPDLLALIAAGASLEEFEGAASTARDRGKGFAYAIGTLKRQRTDAAQTAQTFAKGAVPAAAPPSRAQQRENTMAGLTGRNRKDPAHGQRSDAPGDFVDVEAREVPDGG